MSTLHILSRAPSDSDCWRDCLNACSDGDTLLLIENGVYGATQRPVALAEAVEFIALQADLDARGLSNLPSLAATAVDEAAFVQRAVQHANSVSWF